MRATIAYTSARILLLAVAATLLYLIGARGLLLIALAFVVSGIASFVLLSRQRDTMSGALAARLRKAGNRAADLRARLEEGARAEDAEDAEETEEDGEAAAGKRDYARAEDRD